MLCGPQLCRAKLWLPLLGFLAAGLLEGSIFWESLIS